MRTIILNSSFMKYFFILLQILLITSCGVAQSQYSTTNKKAISLFEEAQIIGNQMDPNTGRYKSKEAIELINKALEKDPKFWEAHCAIGDIALELGDYKLSISSYEAAIAINPNHSATGYTFFNLANAQQLNGDYDAAIKNYDYYVSFRGANPDMVGQAYKMREVCVFSSEALKHPTNFKPINIGPGINTKDPEYFPTITVDGKTILFTRELKNPQYPTRRGQEDFFVSQLSQNRWGMATPMPANINTPLNEGAPSIGADGRTLVFVACSDQSGDNNYGQNRTGLGSCDIFYTKKVGAHWLMPQNLPGKVNSPSWESQPSLSADGKTMYYVKRVSRKGEAPNSDIFYTKLMDDGVTWGIPVRLPMNINTPYEEESVLIHPDGRTLYFASKGHIGLGGSDLYVTRMNPDGTWSKPENLGYPINTKADENSLMVSPDGEIGFFASDREGGYGDLDIYYFEMPEKMRPTKTLYFEGKVFDINTRKPLAGKFRLIDLKTGVEVIYSVADIESGEFMVSLPVNCDYALNVEFPGYNFFSQNFNMTNPEGLEAIHMDVPMIPIESSVPTILKNVFFDLGKATLRPESYIELNKLRDFLKTNANIKIELGGHTDTRGDATENQTLSENRAKAVYDYLIKEGIVATRLSYKGYGETVNINSDDKISKLATEKEKEAAHQENRRTEYKILK